MMFSHKRKMVSAFQRTRAKTAAVVATAAAGFTLSLAPALPAQANESSPSDSFLLSIDLSQNAESFTEVSAEIKEHASLQKAYLSMGESHLEEESTHPIQKMLFSEYLTQPELGGVRLCAESIAAFLESDEGVWLKTQVQSTDVFLLNSPGKTDFTNCAQSDYKRYITYSGLFHQNAFGRAFPKVFAPTSVLTDEGNNIKDQMSGKKGFFVSQMEFPVVEVNETSRVLKETMQDPSTLIQSTKDLTEAGDALRAKMSMIYNAPSEFRKKSGIFIDQKFFAASGLKVLPKSKAYILLTDLVYRRKNESFYFLNHLSKFSSSDLEILFKLMADEKYFFSQVDNPRSADGSFATMTFGGLPKSFKGEAAQLTLYGEGQETLSLAMSSDDAALTCFIGPADHKIDSREAPCAELIAHAQNALR
jgi:hypothetical protein